MTKKLRALIERKTKLITDARAIDKAAEAASRDFTDEERSQSAGLLTQLEALNGDIDRERALMAAEASASGLVISDDASVTGAEPNILKDPKRGFHSFGDFAASVRTRDPRLGALSAAAPSTYGNESVGADGGYLVPPEFSQQVFQHSLEEESILSMTDENPITGNSMVFPKDETTPWGTDGIRAYWESEAALATATKPKLGVAQQRLHKLFGLVPVTDELLSDAATLDRYLIGKTGESIRWKSDDAFINGSGAGMPLGILNSSALVSVAKESAQSADTLVVANIAKMFARMPAGSLARAVWMINNDVLPQLITMVLNNYPIYTPPGAIANAPAGMLLGRPIKITQHAKTLGDKGDIQFVDWKMYRTITKRGGIETATSMHLYFDAGAMAFRATFRVDGQPAISSAITPANGSNSLSPFVTLDERA